MEGIRRGLDLATLEDRVSQLDDPVFQYGVWRLHQMCVHRGISLQDLALEAGVAIATVRETYYGRKNRLGYDGLTGLERLEDAITRITDRRGGIPEICCGQKAYDEIKDVLAFPSIYEEVS